MKITSNAQIFDLDVFKTTSEQEHSLGTKAVDENGNAYRYVKAGATAVVVGKLYNSPASVANHVNLAVAAAASAGANTVTVTLGATAVTANQYAGGKLCIVDADGEGYTYTIKSHPAADASASLVVTIDPSESIKVALTTSSKASLIANRYNGVILHESGTEDSMPVGVSIVPITENNFGWVLTKGTVAVLNGTNAPVIGRAVIASDTVDGAVDTETSTGTDAVRVGVGVVTGSATQYRPVMLNLED